MGVRGRRAASVAEGAGGAPLVPMSLATAGRVALAARGRQARRSSS
jgi:hypothetical protein